MAAYWFHGNAIEISCQDRKIEEALDARLRYFRSSTPGSSPLTFHIGAYDGPDHVSPLPGRVVYEPVMGEVRYRDDNDELLIRHGDRAFVSCRAGEGHVSVEVRSRSPRLVWLASHP